VDQPSKIIGWDAQRPGVLRTDDLAFSSESKKSIDISWTHGWSRNPLDIHKYLEHETPCPYPYIGNLRKERSCQRNRQNVALSTQSCAHEPVSAASICEAAF